MVGRKEVWNEAGARFEFLETMKSCCCAEVQRLKAPVHCSDLVTYSPAACLGLNLVWGSPLRFASLVRMPKIGSFKCHQRCLSALLISS